MFIITNRKLVDDATGPARLGPDPNCAGPNELRVVEAHRRAGKWHIDILPDQVPPALWQSANLKVPAERFASRYAAALTFNRISQRGHHLLFFVHGYNNDVAAVLDRAEGFEKQFDVEVVCFSWPANGGGIKGVADYLADKRDAKLSAGALDRTLTKFCAYLTEFRADLLRNIHEKAADEFPDDRERRDEFITRADEKHCRFTVNMLLHSMGNYLFKNVMDSSVYQSRTQLLFDNVILVAADVNACDHAEWVDRIPRRNRLYVTINEDDSALFASRIKCGDEQLERLGHCVNGLRARQATYVDFTDAAHIGKSHAYFEGAALKNAQAKNFFQYAFTGARAERDLPYHAPSNCYLLRKH